MPATVAKLPLTGPALATSLASNGAPALSTTVTAAAPTAAPGHSARTGAGRASSSLAPSSLDHRVGEPQHAMPALQPVHPHDDPVHQAAQAPPSS